MKSCFAPVIMIMRFATDGIGVKYPAPVVRTSAGPPDPKQPSPFQKVKPDADLVRPLSETRQKQRKPNQKYLPFVRAINPTTVCHCQDQRQFMTSPIFTQRYVFSARAVQSTCAWVDTDPHALTDACTHGLRQARRTFRLTDACTLQIDAD